MVPPLSAAFVMIMSSRILKVLGASRSSLVRLHFLWVFPLVVGCQFRFKKLGKIFEQVWCGIALEFVCLLFAFDVEFVFVVVLIK